MSACKQKGMFSLVMMSLVSVSFAMGGCSFSVPKKIPLSAVESGVGIVRGDQYLSVLGEVIELSSQVGDTTPREEVGFLDIAEIKTTPLWTMKDVVHDLGNLLGYNQAMTIMQHYNSSLITGDMLSPESDFGMYEKIAFPLQYPELKTYFPSTLTGINHLLDLHLSDKELSNPNVIVVAKTSGVVGLAYYSSGDLKVLTSVSPGTLKTRTIEGKYFLTHDKIHYRSGLYGSPMPYAMRIHGPYFLHQSEVNGDYLSHGCIRVPGAYQKWLYEHLPNKSLQQEYGIQAPLMVIHKPYEVTLSD